MTNAASFIAAKALYNVQSYINNTQKHSTNVNINGSSTIQFGPQVISDGVKYYCDNQ